MAGEKLNQGVIMKTLDWAYERAVDGIPGFDSAEEMANNYLKGNGSLSSKVNSLIRWQNTKSATSGFLTGLGGVITLPVAIPANIASVMYVQIRMIAAIAHMAGYDLRDDRVKTLVYTCLCGNAAKDIVKEFGIKIGTKLTETAIKKISAEVIVKINQAVGFRLLTKFGEKGVVNLGKAIPLVGGVIGGTMDGISTNLIGNVARDTFLATS
ncbi:EcsC family protein [Paenibacillus polymyxa]|uniref:EcsC family protein n=1 Tax=Paenibacillus polymyxa TaxID=1406 RepID=UPI00201A0613|nr:EcsC family protein [Paenibacillus polymyxa]UQQ36164.1 EcsC family protein [Paenibacillus polymyxa]